MKNALAQIKRRKRIRAFVLAIIALVILWLSLPLLSQGFFTFLFPLWEGSQTVRDVAREDIGAMVTPRRILVRENEALQEALGDYVAQVRSLEARVRHLEEQQQFTFPIPPGSTMLEGAIYSKPPVSPFGTFLVNVGSKDGVKEGMHAYAGEKILVGSVEKSYAHHSLISLISRPEAVSTLLLEDGIQVEAHGLGGGALFATVPTDTEVEKNQVVYATLPNRPVVGIVEAIQEDEREGELRLFIRQPHNPHELSHLSFVITNTYEEE